MMETNVTLTDPPHTWSLCLFCGLSNLAELLSFRYQINYCLFTHRITSVDGGTGWRNQLDRISMTSTRDIWSCQYSPLFFTLCSQTDRQTEPFPSSTSHIPSHNILFPSFCPILPKYALPSPLHYYYTVILSWCMFVHTSVPSGSFSLFPISPPSHFIFFLSSLSSCNFVYVVVHVRGEPLHHFLPFSCLVVVTAIVTVTDSVKLCSAAFLAAFFF